MYRTAYCGTNGVLIIEVLLYRTAFCGPNGVPIIEVSLYIEKHDFSSKPIYLYYIYIYIYI